MSDEEMAKPNSTASTMALAAESRNSSRESTKAARFSLLTAAMAVSVPLAS
jgi:hypothetical protein